MTAYAAIAFISPQYDQANWFLKFYVPSTDTPLPISIDSIGSTLFAKAEIDLLGFPTTDGTERFIPFLSGSYDAYLFPTAAEADANDTINAIRVAQNADPFGDGFSVIKTFVPVVAGETFYELTFNVSADAVVIVDNSMLMQSNGAFEIDSNGDLTLSEGLAEGQIMEVWTRTISPPSTSQEVIDLTPEMFGASGYPTDDTAAFTSAIALHQTTGLAINLQRSHYKADLILLGNQSIKMFSKSTSKVTFVNKTAWLDNNSVSLINVEFDCSEIPTGTNGFEITRATKIRIKACEVNSAPRTNLVLFDCSNYIVRDNEFNNAGTDEFVSGGGVNIGCGLIMQDCKQTGKNPTVAYNNNCAEPWQMGIFIVNEGVGTESVGNWVYNNGVYGAGDNGIRTQTQGSPFDPTRCREHVVQGNYVTESLIDNYRCNGADNSFVANHSVRASGYGMKSDGGTNNNMSNNHDNGSLVAVGMRMGADTINYAVTNNVSIKSGTVSFQAVIVEDGLTLKNINLSNNTAFDLGASSSGIGLVAVPAITSRILNARVANNMIADSPKQSMDFSQVDGAHIVANTAFRSNQTTATYTSEVSDCQDCNISLNMLTPNVGVSNNSFTFTNGSAGSFGVGNDMAEYNLNTSWLDSSLNANRLQNSKTDFNTALVEYTTNNTSSLGVALSSTMDVDAVLAAGTYQDADKLIMGFFVQLLSTTTDGYLQGYTKYTNN